MMDPVLDQLTASAVVVMLMQWFKDTKWVPFLDAHTDVLNRAAAFIMAAVAAFGVHIEYDHVAGTALISGLGLASMAHGLWHWLTSVAVQELIYKGVIKTPAKV